ncbi:hypothetical protein LF1_55870 [Rubripirellula obstinata]|uniref:Uncharacterized protein n=1 Tax=Rubripirellula obstinata TaxID=406547 RepID=A0A5B1C7X0_9BACT|nr:hypothetical protein LF1_55870 [Rubripirellula obstinata]
MNYSGNVDLEARLDSATQSDNGKHHRGGGIRRASREKSVRPPLRCMQWLSAKHHYDMAVSADFVHVGDHHHV